MTRENAIKLVSKERDRQVTMWGDQRSNTDLKWAAILGEETGEVQKAVNDGDSDNLKEELAQVAAVAIAWLESEF